MFPEIESENRFTSRHIGPRPRDVEQMLASLGLDSLGELVEAAETQGRQHPFDIMRPRPDVAARELILRIHFTVREPTFQVYVRGHPGSYSPTKA